LSLLLDHEESTQREHTTSSEVGCTRLATTDTLGRKGPPDELDEIVFFEDLNRAGVPSHGVGSSVDSVIAANAAAVPQVNCFVNFKNGGFLDLEDPPGSCINYLSQSEDPNGCLPS